MSGAKAEKSEQKPKSKKMLFIIVGLVLAAGGGGGFFWWKGQQAAKAEAADKAKSHKAKASDEVSDEAHAKNAEDATAEEEEEEEEPGKDAGALPFEPFVVNLADEGGSRYLKADIGLIVTGAENMKELEENQVVMLRLRSAILEHLSQKTSEELTTSEGKAALKRELMKRCTKILRPVKVSDVLFKEFVVQF